MSEEVFVVVVEFLFIYLILFQFFTFAQTPGKGTAGLVLGIINLFLFGIGVIIAGALEGDLADVVIGVLQLCIPFVGWAWAIFWGILMIIRSI